MLSYIRQNPSIALRVRIAGWLSLLALLFAPQIGALLYIDRRLPNITDPAALSSLERLYYHSITNFLMWDAFVTLFLLFLGYKALTWLERNTRPPAETDQELQAQS